jgi:PKD repeat protein
MPRRNRILTTLSAALLAASWGCTLQKQEAPAMTGPSELGTSLSVSVSPDVLIQDGASQSVVTVQARDASGQPFRNLSLRAEITSGGVTADFGSLSARSLVTDSNGRATLVYTAPPAPAFSIDTNTIVGITVSPIGSDFGNTTSKTADIRLVPPGVIQPPTTGLKPDFTFTPAAPIDHQPVIFDASLSTTTNATIVSYGWNFGDGGTATGITAQHTFNSPGDLSVTLTVTDSIGRTNTKTKTVTVGQGPNPTAVIVASPASPVVDQTVNFNASTSKPAPGRVIRSYDWNFGDGATGGGVTVAHKYSSPGTYTVVLTVTDDAGRVATATQPVTVSSDAPQAKFSYAPATPKAGSSVTFDGTTSTAAGGRTIVSYAWSFGDGASATGPTTSHVFAAGSYTVVLTVTDSAGKTSTTSQSITVTP